MKNKVLILTGATGVGKSKCAIALAKRYNMEIISADSVQVFKGFDIGSAKISQEEMEGINHYGIDIVSPENEFTVCDFVCFAKDKINEIIARGKLPLIVGGTGLYIKALVEGFNFGGTDKKIKFRKDLDNIAKNKGINALYELLKEKSPKLAEETDKNNKIRIIRAIEIAYFGSEKRKQKDENNDFHIIALNLPREELYKKINLRCDEMLKSGLVAEVKELYSKFGNCQPMRAIGYKEVVSYINGEISYDELVNILSQHTRNYAKRQLTFMRGMDNISYFDMSEKNVLNKIEENIEEWLHKQ